MTERVSLMLGASINQAEIVVSPPDMGPVRIELSMSGNDARLVFTAAQPETRQAIEQSAPLLRSMLSEQGLQMSGFDVGSGNPFQQAQRDSGNGDFGRTMSERGNSHRIAGALDPTGGISAQTTVRRGLLDLFA